MASGQADRRKNAKEKSKRSPPKSRHDTEAGNEVIIWKIYLVSF